MTPVSRGDVKTRMRRPPAQYASGIHERLRMGAASS